MRKSKLIYIATPCKAQLPAEMEQVTASGQGLGMT